MHDQVRMRVSNGGQHVEEETDARLDIESVLVAVPVDVLARDVFQHEIGLPVQRNAGVQELSNVRVRQPGQDRAFPFESLLTAAPSERDMEELHRRLALES